jgi:hypothetical protein
MMFDRLRLGLTGGLTPQELQTIQDDALSLLADIGMRIDHEGVLKFLESLPGVTRSGNRARLSRELVGSWLPAVREQNGDYYFNRPGDPWRLVPPYLPANYRDPMTHAVRPATAADHRLSVKLCDALGMYGPPPLHVQEGPVAMRQLLTFKICLEHSRELGGSGPATSAAEAEFLIAMGQAVGRPPPYGAMEIPISPLRLNGDLLGILLERQGRDNQLLGIIVGGGAVPLPGATAPLSFPACLSQGLAEALGAYIVPKLIDPRILGYCSFGGYLFNLRTMDTYHAYFPESLLYNLMVRQVIRFTLHRTMGHAFKVDFLENPGKLYQVGYTGAILTLLGARSIHVGAEKGDVFSPLTAVICADLVRHLAKLIDGLPLERTSDSTRQLVEPGLESGMYTDQESTLNYRDLYVDLKLLFRYDDHASLMAAAREEMQRRLAAHAFALPADVQRELEKVYTAAQRALSPT